MLRIYRGGEYVIYFLFFCKIHGIHKQFAVHYTPQQNSDAERKNITITEMAHNMMASKHLSNEYYDEVVETDVYIMNRCPTKSVKNKISQESWTCMKYSVSHIMFWLCPILTCSR